MTPHFSLLKPGHIVSLLHMYVHRERKREREREREREWMGASFLSTELQMSPDSKRNTCFVVILI